MKLTMPEGLGLLGAVVVGALLLLGSQAAPPQPAGESDESLPQAQNEVQQFKFPVGTISKIEFEGNATITADKIKPMLLSRVGEPLSQAKVEADLRSLMGTKWFSDVTYYLEESPPKSGKFTLSFAVREMPPMAPQGVSVSEARPAQGGHEVGNSSTRLSAPVPTGKAARGEPLSTP